MIIRTPEPEDVVALIDTREQRPWDLTPLRSKRATLTTGDYSLVGRDRTGGVTLERKSLSDLLGCISGSRKRFLEVLERMQAYSVRCVIIEDCTWEVFTSGCWGGGYELAPYSKVHVNSAVGSVLAWMSRGIPFLFCETPEVAGRAAARILYIEAKRWVLDFRQTGWWENGGGGPHEGCEDSDNKVKQYTYERVES